VLALPPFLAYIIRALVVPAAFMAAAFLAPLAPPITAQLEAEARATLADVFRIARRQRRRMLRQAQRSGRDMTGALGRARAGSGRAARDPARLCGHRCPCERTDGSVNHHCHARGAKSTSRRPGEHPVGDVRTARAAAHGTGRTDACFEAPRTQQGRRPAVLRLAPPETAEQRIRAVIADYPTISIRQLAQRADVSHSTASKYARVVRLEASHAAQ
jgi:hypothetical protein